MIATLSIQNTNIQKQIATIQQGLLGSVTLIIVGTSPEKPMCAMSTTFVERESGLSDKTKDEQKH